MCHLFSWSSKYCNQEGLSVCFCHFFNYQYPGQIRFKMENKSRLLVLRTRTIRHICKFHEISKIYMFCLLWVKNETCTKFEVCRLLLGLARECDSCQLTGHGSGPTPGKSSATLWVTGVIGGLSGVTELLWGNFR